MAKRFIDLPELETELKGRRIPVSFTPESGKYAPIFEVGTGAVKYVHPTLIHDPAGGLRVFNPQTDPYSTVGPSSDGRYISYGDEAGPLLAVGGGWAPRRKTPNRLSLQRLASSDAAAILDCIDGTETAFSATAVTTSDFADEIEALYLVAVQSIDFRAAARRKRDAEEFKASLAMVQSVIDSLSGTV